MTKSMMRTKPSWRVVSISQEPRRRVSALSVLAAITLLTVAASAGYAIYFMHSLSIEFRAISAQARKLDKLDSTFDDIHRLSATLGMAEKANARVKKMESYVSYIPRLSKTADQALAQATATNHKLEITNQRLLATDKSLTGTIDRLAGVADSMKSLPGEFRQVRGSIDKMAGQFAALGQMRDLLAKTSDSLDTTSQGISKVSGGLDNMQLLLKSMNDQFSVLPEMKTSLDGTNANIATAMAAFQPLHQDIPRLWATLDEMNQASREMNQTTQEMARGMKKLPKQSAISAGLFTAAQFLVR